MNSAIGFIVVTLISSSKILINADNECKESVATAKLVISCPKTRKEWNDAAERKGCRKITNICSSFEYHCVLNAWRNETIEVCAPRWNIVGRSCAEYSFGGKRIQIGMEGACKTCLLTYSSTESYKYQECYKSAMKLTTIKNSQETNESAVIIYATPEYNNSSSVTALKQGINQALNSYSENVSSHLIAIIACVVGVFVLVIVVLIVYKSRTTLVCSKIYRLVLTVEENRVHAPPEECTLSNIEDPTKEENDLLTDIPNSHEICIESNTANDLTFELSIS